jgi:transposase
MTCGRCLNIEESFRKNSSKHFKCLGCHYENDRDLNGARNITLMNLERYVGTVKV